MSRATPTGNTYDKLAATHPIERRMVRGFLERLDALLPDAAPGTILEVGVGEGIVAQRLGRRYPQALVFGVDLPDPRLAAHWRKRETLGVYGDAQQLPVRDGSCGLVVAIEVLEHVAEPERALHEIARVASGTVVLSVPLEPLWRIGNLLRGRYVRDRGNTPGHLQHWTRRGFVRLVERHLEVDRVTSPLPWTMVRARATR